MTAEVDPSRSVWQISAGPSARSYSDVFLRYGVALIGPGDAGEWLPEFDDSRFEGSFVRRFASEVVAGDAVLLRIGISAVCAVGLVVDDYQYVDAFDDVNGWDLQHARRVRWCLLPKEHIFGGSVFGAMPPRCSRVWNEEVLDFARRFLKSPPSDWQTAPLPELPAEEEPLDDVPLILTDIVAQARDFVPLVHGPPAFGDWPSEDELITHFVVPFLRALGWPPEHIAIQWRRIDVALFRKLPRMPENCEVVIEAKRLGAGVEVALDQAMGYVEDLRQRLDVVVTDGIRYRMYSGERECKPIAYANLMRLKRSALTLFDRLQFR